MYAKAFRIGAAWVLVALISACGKQAQTATVASNPTTATPASAPAAFDRAAAVKRVEERFAAMETYAQRMQAKADELTPKGKPPDEKLMDELIKKDPPPTFVDLVPDARQIIRQDPKDAAASQAIRVLLIAAEFPGNASAGSASSDLIKEVTALLIEHFAKSDEILEFGGMVPFRNPVDYAVFWQAIYERADATGTKAMAAFLAAQGYFDAVDRGNLPEDQAAAMRSKGKELMTLVKTKYAAEKVHLRPMAKPGY